MDQLKGIAGPVCFAILALTFGFVSVKYGSPWAQTISQQSFTAACIAFQLPQKS
jgi:hypothetical protein